MDLMKECVIAAPIEDVWRALTDPALMAQWSGAPAEMTPRAGGAFLLWGGEVSGANLTVEPPRRLVQAWFCGDWPQASVAELLLSERGAQTWLTLLHTRIPDDAAQQVEACWDERYFRPLQTLLGERAGSARLPEP